MPLTKIDESFSEVKFLHALTITVALISVFTSQICMYPDIPLILFSGSNIVIINIHPARIFGKSKISFGVLHINRPCVS